MNENRYWLSRITPRAGIGWKELTRLGGLDLYGQHQAVCRLFELPPKEQRHDKPTPFLFRTERIEPASAVAYAHPDLAGLPVFYVLSQQMPEDRSCVWQIEAQQYRPDLHAGDRLAFKLRVNPVILAKTERSKEEQQAWLKNRRANNFKQKVPTKKRVRHDVGDGRQTENGLDKSSQREPTDALASSVRRRQPLAAWPRRKAGL